ncbi:transposase [[Leptolyngbya] sp. PCC 7376]|nr:transposase [[Leptolyngbya] sp. PCC 7376]
MPTYEQLQHLSTEQFRRACGVKLQTFNRLVEVLAEAKVKQKPGRPSIVSLENQLLLTLEYLREYRTYFPIAQSWGIHESTVCRMVQKTENTLIKETDCHLPGMKQLHGSEELSLTVVVMDATEQAIEKPKKQRLYYSGKKKHHSLKAQIVIAWQWAQIICCDCEKGSTHDFKLLKKSRVHFQQGQLCLADAGYQGLHKRHQRSHTPHKKPKGGELTAEQKQENQLLAAQRIIIEMVFRMLKRFRLLSSRYRNRRRRWGLRLNLIAGLYNFELP